MANNKIKITLDKSDELGISRQKLALFESGKAVKAERIRMDKNETPIEAAKRFMRAKKENSKKSITLYLYESDIKKARKIAKEEGAGYQTVIASILHSALEA